MWGRFKRKADKREIAQVFEVTAGLDEIEFDSGDDLRPQDMQPVVYLDEHYERRKTRMRYLQRATRWRSWGETQFSSMM